MVSLGKSLLAEKMSFVEQDKTLYLNSLTEQGHKSTLLILFCFSFLCDTVIALQTSGSTGSASQSEAPPLVMGAIQLAEKSHSKSLIKFC